MIATIVDEGTYLLNMTKYLIKSLAVHMPNEKFCLVLVNGSGKYDNEIRTWHPNLILKNYPLHVDKEYEKGYQFCYMTLPLHELLVEFDEPLIYMDGDIVVRGSIQPLFEDLNKYDYMVRYRPFLETDGPLSATHGAKVNNGVTCFANNKKTRLFTLELRNRIVEFLNNGGDPIRWSEKNNAVTAIDQELLWLLYLEYQNEIKFFPTDDRYNDSVFKNDSIIWHAKGVARNYPEYRIECYKYGRRDIDLFSEYVKLYYKKFRRLVKNTFFNDSDSFKIAELEKILADSNIDDIVIVNSDFYLDNETILKGIMKIDCYDIDPAIYHRNKKTLQAKNVNHNYLVFDTQSIFREKTNLVICEHKYKKVIATISSDIRLIKNENALDHSIFID